MHSEYEQGGGAQAVGKQEKKKYWVNVEQRQQKQTTLVYSFKWHESKIKILTCN